jgi:hypothetical protein
VSTGLRLWIGVHTGTPLLADTGYVDIDVRPAAESPPPRTAADRRVWATRELAGERFELVDLGEHRLKDLPAGERLFQLGAGRFPPLKTLNQTNLPPVLRGAGRPPGRDPRAPQPAPSRRGIRGHAHGARGTAKSRLAFEVVPQYRDGVWFISLATLSDPTLVRGDRAGAGAARG